MLKKIIYFTSFVIIFSMIPIYSFAGTNNLDLKLHNKVINRWVGVSTTYPKFIISGQKAELIIEIYGLDKRIDNANFEVNLNQFKNGKWILVKKWKNNKSINKNRALFNQIYITEKGYKYKFTGTIKVYSGNTLLETIKVQSNEVKC